MEEEVANTEWHKQNRLSSESKRAAKKKKTIENICRENQKRDQARQAAWGNR